MAQAVGSRPNRTEPQRGERVRVCPLPRTILPPLRAIPFWLLLTHDLRPGLHSLCRFAALTRAKRWCTRTGLVAVPARSPARKLKARADFRRKFVASLPDNGMTHLSSPYTFAETIKRLESLLQAQ